MVDPAERRRVNIDYVLACLKCYEDARRQPLTSESSYDILATSYRAFRRSHRELGRNFTIVQCYGKTRRIWHAYD